MGPVGCAAVVLTGGASRRMGRDKAGTPGPGGVALAARTAALAATCADPVVELGPGASGHPWRPDGGGGPLAALAAAGPLWAALPPGGHVLVLATDLPRLGAGVLRWLVDHPAPGAVVPVEAGRPQPLCARYPVAALAALAPSAGGRLLDWVASLGPHWAAEGEWAAPAGDPLALRDADTPEQLAELCGGAR